MAIVSDLAKETSFRRFYLRWLVAVWLPPIVTAGIWAWLFFDLPAAMQIVGLFLPIDLWALVALGQWWFMSRYTRSGGLYAFLTFLGGIVGTVFWLTLWNHDPPAFMGLISLIVTPLLSYLIFGFQHSWLHATAGTFLFGAAIGCCQAWLIAPGLADRVMWIMLNGVLAAVLLLLLFPYVMNQLTEILWTRAMLDNDLFDAFEGLPRSAVALCAVWLAHASAFGVILWAMRWNQVRRGNAGMVQMFD